MTTLNIIMGTTAALMLLESLIIVVFPKTASMEIKKIIPTKKTILEREVIGPLYKYFKLRPYFFSASMVLTCGYGLVVECILAKDKTGVRFSLPAPKTKNPPYGGFFVFL